MRTAIPAPPTEPEYYPVQWQAGNGTWCLDERNAKSLLKNIEIMKAYQNEMRQMLIKLSEGNK